jgi:hypothetical protein
MQESGKWLRDFGSAATPTPTVFGWLHRGDRFGNNSCKSDLCAGLSTWDVQAVLFSLVQREPSLATWGVGLVLEILTLYVGGCCVISVNNLRSISGLVGWERFRAWD